jgi:hypothetical protein
MVILLTVPTTQQQGHPLLQVVHGSHQRHQWPLRIVTTQIEPCRYKYGALHIGPDIDM